MSAVAGLVHRARTLVRRMLTRTSQRRDPWERLAYRPPAGLFGRGSLHPFPWYFEGSSNVPVGNVNDICDWLLACEYARDPELFNESDFWQHPSTFERLRRGDCEDYALWAWRKLVELGHEAELMSGTWHQLGAAADGHVWVRFRHDGQEYILESVSRTRATMVRPFEIAREEYVPHAGVDQAFQLHAYHGYLHETGG